MFFSATSASVLSSNNDEFTLKSDQHFPNRAKSIACLTTIGSYTSDLFVESDPDSKSVVPTMSATPAKKNVKCTTAIHM